MNKIYVQIRNGEMVAEKKSAFLRFGFDRKLIDKIKSMPVRYWNGETKYWEIPINDLQQLAILCPEYELEIEEETYNLDIPDDFQFKFAPLPHQKEAIKYGLNHPSFLNGDQPGLGKTYESLMISEIRRESEKLNHCLILCGINTLQKSWQKEVEKFTTQSAVVIGERKTRNGTVKAPCNQDKLEDLKRIDSLPYYLILNIESIRNEELADIISDLCVCKINMIIFDECHKCKGMHSIQSNNLLRLNAKYKLALSGTPMLSKPLDIYVVMRWIGIEQRNPFQFSNYYRKFKKIKVKDKQGKIQERKVPIGFQHLDEIKNKMNNFMIRRLKKDVLDLPEKIYKYEYLDMYPAQSKLYNEIHENTLKNAEKIKRMENPLVAFLRLRQCVADTSLVSETVSESVKLDRMMDIVEERIQNKEKIIIFTYYHSVARKAAEKLKAYNPAIVFSESLDVEKEKNKFRSGETDVIIGTTNVLGTGHTLTEASVVLFLDQPWTQGELEQAEDRAHRIGQNKTVEYITLICSNTVDERVNEIVSQKAELADMLVDSTIKLSVDYLLKR